MAARKLLPEVELTDAVLTKVAEVCAAFEVDGMRADIVTARTAIAHAAWHGRTRITRADIRQAALLALPHRRRRNPFDAPGLDEDLLDQILGDEEPDPEPPGPEPEPPEGPEPDGESDTDAGRETDRSSDQPDRHTSDEPQGHTDGATADPDRMTSEGAPGQAPTIGRRFGESLQGPPAVRRCTAPGPGSPGSAAAR